MNIGFPTRRKFLACASVSGIASVLGGACTYTGKGDRAASSLSTQFEAAGSDRAFSPPLQTQPYVHRVAPGESRFPTAADVSAGRAYVSGGYRYFNPDLDVIILWPDSPLMLSRTAWIQGGRHVRSIGGRLINDGMVTSMFAFSMQTGSMFCEGMHVDVAGAYCDAFVNRWYREVAAEKGIRARSHPGVTLQHCLATGVNGTFEGVHGDAYQGQGPIDLIRIEEFTFESAYQGIFVPKTAPPKGLWLRRCNGRFYEPRSGSAHLYNYWFHTGRETRTSPIYPIRLEQVFAAESPSPYDQWNIYASMPNDTLEWGPALMSDAEGEYYDFSGLGIDIRGVVRRGEPPTGDFVTAESCGTNYNSSWPIL